MCVLIVKAGGMRVVTKHRHKDHDVDAYDEKYKDSVNPIGSTKYINFLYHISYYTIIELRLNKTCHYLED